MYMSGRVTNLDGEPVAGCTIETWETDFEGLYDTVGYHAVATYDLR